jgi:hypothetical protein
MVGKTAEPEAAPEPETQPEADPAPETQTEKEEIMEEKIKTAPEIQTAEELETPPKPQPETPAEVQPEPETRPEPEAAPETQTADEPEIEDEPEAEPIVFKDEGTYIDKKRFADIKFIAQAVSIDETRPFMQVIHAQKHNDDTLLLVSTDGRRLHTLVYYGHDRGRILREPGDYAIMENKAHTIILKKIPETAALNFPAWEKVMPPRPREIFTGLRFAHAKATKKRNAVIELDKAMYMLNNIGALINLDYLKDLDIDGAEWTAYKDPDKEPILFVSDNPERTRQALIMPLQNLDLDSAIVSAQKTLSESDLISLADFPPMQEDEYETISVSYLPGPDAHNETAEYEETLAEAIAEKNERTKAIRIALAQKPTLPPGIEIREIKKSRKSRNQKPDYRVKIEKSGSVIFKIFHEEKEAYRFAEAIQPARETKPEAIQPETKSETARETKPIRAVADKPLSIPGTARKNRKPWEALNYTLEF